MRISRLFVAQVLHAGMRVSLDEETAHYVRTVLRLKSGQVLVLFNGEGFECVGHIAEVSRKAVVVQIERVIERNVESALQLHLGLGISRGDRMDWAVQKAVELGVQILTPLITERCVVRFDAEKKQQRAQHWQHIVQHAAEQSGRTVLPGLGPVTTLNDWLGDQRGLKVFLDPYAETTLADLQPESGQVTLLSGPEGGFSDQERVAAKAAGFVPVRMGPRILRTETALLTALVCVNMLW